MKVFIYGTGKIAEQVRKNIDNAEVMGYIETSRTKSVFYGSRVYSLEEIPPDYDVIIIGVSGLYQDAVIDNCRYGNVPMDKICVLREERNRIDRSHNLELAKEIFSEDYYAWICSNFGIYKADWVEEDAKKYAVLNKRSTFAFEEKYKIFVYSDKTAGAGSVNSYFWQDLWAARKVFQNNCEYHYDIGSRLDGFIAHLLSFGRKVNLIDIRPLDSQVEGLFFTKADATNLNGIADNSIESLSALCSLEHFGLGRYGDSIDPEACFKCFAAIGRKMKEGGNLYLSVPIGKEHLEFNAHRIFYAATILDSFQDFECREFSAAYDEMIEYNIDIHKYDDELALGGRRFGLFHLMKKRASKEENEHAAYAAE